MLPNVKINFENGALGLVSSSSDGVMAICFCGAEEVAGSFEYGTPYSIRKYKDLAASLGVTSENNPEIVKIVNDFYKEASEGTKLWLMPFEETEMATVMDRQKSEIDMLVEVSLGEVHGVFCVKIADEDYTPDLEEGIDADVYDAITPAQNFAGKWATEEKYAPVFVILDGYGFNGSTSVLRALNLRTDHNVGVHIGKVQEVSKDDNGDEVKTAHSAIGLLAGRVAAIPVQRNIGRVKDGAVAAERILIDDTRLVETFSDLETIQEKGYITYRTFVGRSGYFYTGDCLAALETDDYNTLARRRTIDKAYRIAYDTLLNELNEEIPINSDGTMQVGMIKVWETMVESAISSSMTANGELSADPSDSKDMGVKCFIDPEQNVLSAKGIEIEIRVRPFGYAEYMNVSLGFTAVNA